MRRQTLLELLEGKTIPAYVQDKASKQEQLAKAQAKRERKRAKLLAMTLR